jgi:hypothetical protein
VQADIAIKKTSNPKIGINRMKEGGNFSGVFIPNVLCNNEKK